MLIAKPISITAFTTYRAYTLNSLASELARVRYLTSEQAHSAAERSLKALFPEDRPDAKDQFIFELISGENIVGILHFGIKRDAMEPYIYLWDILIHDSFRGRGYGREAMKILETKSNELGFKRIMFHVFGDNHVARKLYESLGYTISSVWMEKKLD